MKTVVLVGGSGNRLWPLSRKNYPKQFLKVDSTFSLFQETILRNRSISDGFILISGSKYGFTIANHLDEIGQKDCRMILENIGRNTAPALALACLEAGPDELLLAAPSDHKIIGAAEYRDAVGKAAALAENGRIVTFGIAPSGPNTGYGYIGFDGDDVLSFKEKPDRPTAEEYVKSGAYLWNSGMFMFKSHVFLEELRKFRPDIYNACTEAYARASEKNGSLQIDLSGVPAESVDYAILEKSDITSVVSAGFDWYDVGCFEAYGDFIVKDEAGNTLDQNAIYRNCRNVLAINDAPDKLIVANRLEDIVIVNSSDTVYVSRAGNSQDIKEIIAENEDSRKLNEYFSDTLRSHRPWGYYEVLLSEPGYKIKRIVIYPGRRISLQKHEFRSEHWTIAEGEAIVTVGDTIAIYKQNQNVYIPLGAVHRAENRMPGNLCIIETGIGDNVEESDVIRFEDDYGRV